MTTQRKKDFTFTNYQPLFRLRRPKLKHLVSNSAAVNEKSNTSSTSNSRSGSPVPPPTPLNSTPFTDTPSLSPTPLETSSLLPSNSSTSSLSKETVTYKQLKERGFKGTKYDAELMIAQGITLQDVSGDVTLGDVQDSDQQSRPFLGIFIVECNKRGRFKMSSYQQFGSKHHFDVVFQWKFRKLAVFELNGPIRYRN